ncbi:MAG TPA: hypothetical protein VH306_06720 [Gaiellaceae bacterium]|jgi:hypothetical protein
MEEARAVLERLDRIESLDRARAEPELLLDELRALVREAEAWARRERDPGAFAAAEALAGRAGVLTRLGYLDGSDPKHPWDAATVGRPLEGMSSC